MKNIIETLERRLISFENIAQTKRIPSELDEYELEQVIGRIKELKFIIELIKSE